MTEITKARTVVFMKGKKSLIVPQGKREKNEYSKNLVFIVL